ncbi:MAG: DUF1697 domain-containing protein [Gemmatimonadota bacterium]|nr:DUF1697 domain-containing protein [Gemmatimonadota bacterium]
MTRYIAFLRAINVGGRVVKMDRLREIFEARKLRNVETFIASGNVIFDARGTDAAEVEQEIERHLKKTLGYEVATFLRTPAELAAIAIHPAYGASESMPAEHSLLVGFMRSALNAEAHARLAACTSDVDEFRAHDRQTYWLCRTRLAETKVSGPRLEKALGSPVTFRNINTVRRLVAKYAARDT